MLDGSKDSFVKSVQTLNASLEDELDPARFKDENGNLVFDDEITTGRAMLMIRFFQNRIIAKGLPPFLRLYVDKHLDGVSGKMIEAALRAACDEKHVQAVLYVARHSGEELSLSDVTSTVYDSDRAKHNSYRARIRDKVIPKLGKVELWTSRRSDDDSWTIMSGPALDDFVTLVFTYWAKRQARFFGEFLSKRDDD